MFKVGDRVRFRSTEAPLSLGVDNTLKGKAGTVDRISSTGIVHVHPDCYNPGHGQHVAPDDLILIDWDTCDNCKDRPATQTLLELHLCSTCYRAVIAWASKYSKEMEAVIGG
ncbi:MAG: hypothetical protein ABSC17_09805 [Thermacetogeniaceae bacterium]